jgi:plastocyanin
MRRAMLSAIVGAAVLTLGTPGAALAGGGCHTGATQGDATGKKEATVRIVDACFTASILKVDPETPVTFVNTDAGLIHNVGGNQWGQFDDMHTGDAFTATFTEEGVYPFACSYHPGMTGAIVVGDGLGAGSGEAVGITPLDRETKADAAPTAITTAPVAASASPLPWIAAGVGGMALGVAIAFGVGRPGRTRATS